MYVIVLSALTASLNCSEPPTESAKKDAEAVVSAVKVAAATAAKVEKDTKKREIKVSMEEAIELPENFSKEEVLKKFKANWFEKAEKKTSDPVKLIKNDGDPIAQVEYQQAQDNETDYIFTIKNKVSLATLSGPFAVRTLRASEIKISIRSDKKKTTLKISLTETSRHPGGMADYRLSDDKFYSDVESGTKDCFSSDVKRVRDSMPLKSS